MWMLIRRCMSESKVLFLLHCFHFKYSQNLKAHWDCKRWLPRTKQIINRKISLETVD